MFVGNDLATPEIIEQPTFWELAAQSLWGTYISEIEKDAVLRAHNIAGKPSRALEIGCEGGRWSKLLSDLSWKMTCTDVDAKVLKLCQLRLPAASCIVVEPGSDQIPCETNSIELLLCMEVAQVVNAHWFPQESRRVLTAGGLIVGIFLNFASWRGLLSRLTVPMRRSYAYYELSYIAWRKTLCSNGFNGDNERGVCLVSFG